MRRNIKILLTGLALIVFNPFVDPTYSQSLKFCEDVSKEGDPINAISVFSISDKGGHLKCLTTLPYRVGTASVSYEVYKVDPEGNEKYDSTIYQEVDPSYTWFWKEITFSDEGSYNISVYDSDKNFLASAQIRIQYY